MNPEIFPIPAFIVGQKVRVIMNDRNRTLREGSVHSQIWHYERKEWSYYLKVPGKTKPWKKVSKRYFENDLESVPE